MRYQVCELETLIGIFSRKGKNSASVSGQITEMSAWNRDLFEHSVVFYFAFCSKTKKSPRIACFLGVGAL